MISGTITFQGKSTQDACDAIREALRLIENDFTTGSWYKNENGGFAFNLEGEEESEDEAS